MDQLEDGHCDVLMGPKAMKALGCRPGDLLALHCSTAEGRVPSPSSDVSPTGEASVAAVVRQAPPSLQEWKPAPGGLPEGQLSSAPVFLTSSLAHSLGLRVGVLALSTAMGLTSAAAAPSQPAGAEANGPVAPPAVLQPILLPGVIVRIETLGSRAALPQAGTVRVAQVREQSRELPVDATGLKAFQSRYQQKGSALILNGADKRGNMEERSIAALQYFFSHANRVLSTGSVISVYVPRGTNWPAPPALASGEGQSDVELLTWAAKHFVLLNFRIVGFEVVGGGATSSLVPCSFRTDADAGVMLKTEGRCNALLPTGTGALALSELMASIVASGATMPSTTGSTVPAPILGFHTAALASEFAVLEAASRRPLMPTWRTAARQAAAYFLSVERGDQVQAGILLLGPHG